MERLFPTIVVDTREQRPFEFRGFKVARRKLAYGDYCLQGMQRFLVIERKSFADVFCTVTVKRNFERFARELEGLRSVRFSFLLVESTPEALIGGFARSNASGGLLMDKLLRLCLEYDIQVVFAGGRPWSERVALSILRAGCTFVERH